MRNLFAGIRRILIQLPFVVPVCATRYIQLRFVVPVCATRYTITIPYTGVYYSFYMITIRSTGVYYSLQDICFLLPSRQWVVTPAVCWVTPGFQLSL